MASETNLPLPEGWVRDYSYSHNRYYYSHKETKHKQWKFPSESEARNPWMAKRRADECLQRQKERQYRQELSSFGSDVNIDTEEVKVKIEQGEERSNLPVSSSPNESEKMQDEAQGNYLAPLSSSANEPEDKSSKDEWSGDEENHVPLRPEQQFSFGTKIERCFVDPDTSKPRMFEGYVQRYEYCHYTQKWMYLAVYDDGESEHLTESAVKKHLKVISPQTPHRNDVLCGSGPGINSHPGNQVYRECIRDSQGKNQNASRNYQLKAIAYEVMSLVQNQTPSGRFLRRDDKNRFWTTAEPEWVLGKISRALAAGRPCQNTAQSTKAKKSPRFAVSSADSKQEFKKIAPSRDATDSSAIDDDSREVEAEDESLAEPIVASTIDKVSRQHVASLMAPIDKALSNLGWRIERRYGKKHYYPPGETWDSQNKRLNTASKIITFLKKDTKWSEAMKTAIAKFDASIEEEAGKQRSQDADSTKRNVGSVDSTKKRLRESKDDQILPQTPKRRKSTPLKDKKIHSSDSEDDEPILPRFKRSKGSSVAGTTRSKRSKGSRLAAGDDMQAGQKKKRPKLSKGASAAGGNEASSPSNKKTKETAPAMVLPTVTANAVEENVVEEVDALPLQEKLEAIERTRSQLIEVMTKRQGSNSSNENDPVCARIQGHVDDLDNKKIDLIMGV